MDYHYELIYSTTGSTNYDCYVSDSLQMIKAMVQGLKPNAQEIFVYNSEPKKHVIYKYDHKHYIEFETQEFKEE